MFIFRNVKLTVRLIVKCLKVAASCTCIYHWASKIKTIPWFPTRRRNV